MLFPRFACLQDGYGLRPGSTGGPEARVPRDVHVPAGEFSVGLYVTGNSPVVRLCAPINKNYQGLKVSSPGACLQGQQKRFIFADTEKSPASGFKALG